MEILQNSSLLASRIFNEETFIEFVVRFIFNVFVIYIIARQIYYRLKPNRNYLFTMVIINIVVFFVCYLLNNINLSIGFAFGIFAIFSILRYRTKPIPIKEMTYMFISISIAIINALGSTNTTVVEIGFTNFSIVAFTFLLEKTWVKRESDKTVIYEKIENIKPSNHDKLLEDLNNRTGLQIHRIEIGQIDLLRDTARVKVYYYENN